MELKGKVGDYDSPVKEDNYGDDDGSLKQKGAAQNQWWSDQVHQRDDLRDEQDGWTQQPPARLEGEPHIIPRITIHKILAIAVFVLKN